MTITERESFALTSTSPPLCTSIRPQVRWCNYVERSSCQMDTQFSSLRKEISNTGKQGVCAEGAREKEGTDVKEQKSGTCQPVEGEEQRPVGDEWGIHCLF